MTFLDLPSAGRMAIPIGRQRVELAWTCVDAIAIGKFRCPDPPFCCHAQSSSLEPLRFRDFVLGLYAIRAVGKSVFQDRQSRGPPSQFSPQIGRASCREKCKSRWSMYQE